MQHTIPQPDGQDLTFEIVLLRRQLAAVEIALALAPVVVLLALGYVRRWVAEDAFIDFRVVRNLLAGYGPVYNVGERVEAYTNPLWVALLAIWGGLGGPIEVGSVVLGLLFSAVGLGAALLGARLLARRIEGVENSPPSGIVLPLGAVVVLAVPPVWDFVTSGLETGLTFGWLGVSFWLLVRLLVGEAAPPASQGDWSAPRDRVRWLGTAALIGVGPLVRPDLAIFALSFLVALGAGYGLAPGARRGIRHWAQLLAAAAALPVLYEVFRMGYFATLVPNTALAKEASGVYWASGGKYIEDFVETYVLWVPLLLLLTYWVSCFVRVCTERRWIILILLSAPVVAAGVHLIYVTRMGGDFMHGRMLLPTLYGGMLPLLAIVVPLARRRMWVMLGLGIALLGWALVSAVTLRVAYTGIGPAGVADERDFYVRCAGTPNPITRADYQGCGFTKEGVTIREQFEAQRLKAVAAGGNQAELPPVLLMDHPDSLGPRWQFPLRANPAALPPGISQVAAKMGIGISGYELGPDVFLIDRNGLTDPLASRVWLPRRVGRVGHEKELPPVWVIARFADPNLQIPNLRGLAEARQALACGGLAELLPAVQEPLSPGRFVQNIFLSWKLTGLRIHGDPVEAVRKLCAQP